MATLTLGGTRLMEYKEISGIYNGGPVLNKKLQNQLNQYPDRYEEGTDYYHLTGELLRRFKLENPEKAKSSHFIAWTKPGAAKLCTNVGLDPKVITAAFEGNVPQRNQFGPLINSLVSYVETSRQLLDHSRQMMERSQQIVVEHQQLMRQYMQDMHDVQHNVAPQVSALIHTIR